MMTLPIERTTPQKPYLKNTDAFTEETQRQYFRNGFAYFADYLELYRHSVGEDLTQADITPKLIEQYLLHLKGSELGYNSQKPTTHISSQC